MHATKRKSKFRQSQQTILQITPNWRKKSEASGRVLTKEDVRAWPRVLIACPSMRSVENKFYISMLSVAMYTVRAVFMGAKLGAFSVADSRGSMLPTKRHNMVKQAIEKDMTHILWIDTDQVVPEDIVFRMLRWDRDIVACNISTKTIPAHPTAYRLNKDGQHEKVFSFLEDASCTEVDHVGMGVMMTKVDVFKNLPQPWFNMQYIPERDAYGGQDWFFIDAAKKAGYKVYVDQSTSTLIGHVGDLTYTHDLIDGYAEMHQLFKDGKYDPSILLPEANANAD